MSFYVSQYTGVNPIGTSLLYQALVSQKFTLSRRLCTGRIVLAKEATLSFERLPAVAGNPAPSRLHSASRIRSRRPKLEAEPTMPVQAAFVREEDSEARAP